MSRRVVCIWECERRDKRRSHARWLGDCTRQGSLSIRRLGFLPWVPQSPQECDAQEFERNNTLLKSLLSTWKAMLLLALREATEGGPR